MSTLLLIMLISRVFRLEHDLMHRNMSSASELEV
jgi:hypothetical protein